MKSSPRSLQPEKACAQQQRPNAAKNKKIKNKFKKKVKWSLFADEMILYVENQKDSAKILVRT